MLGHCFLVWFACADNGGQYTLVIYSAIASKFQIWTTFIKTLPKFDYGLFNNQDGRKNGRHLSICTCGHSNLVIYHLLSSKFHTWTTFITLLFISEYGFSLMNDNQD